MIYVGLRIEIVKRKDKETKIHVLRLAFRSNECVGVILISCPLTFLLSRRSFG